MTTAWGSTVDETTALGAGWTASCRGAWLLLHRHGTVQWVTHWRDMRHWACVAAPHRRFGRHASPRHLRLISATDDLTAPCHDLAWERLCRWRQQVERSASGPPQPCALLDLLAVPEAYDGRRCAGHLVLEPHHDHTGGVLQGTAAVARTPGSGRRILTYRWPAAVVNGRCAGLATYRFDWDGPLTWLQPGPSRLGVLVIDSLAPDVAQPVAVGQSGPVARVRHTGHPDLRLV